jgi:hypothetical protein
MKLSLKTDTIILSLTHMKRVRYWACQVHVDLSTFHWHTELLVESVVHKNSLFSFAATLIK